IKLERFPLDKADPFLPGDGMVHLRGYANGNLTLRGTSDKPVLNGSVVGDSAYVTLPRYGAELRLSNDSINISDSYIAMNNYRLYGLNDRPVTINGNVDIRDLDNMGIDLRMHGDNVQVIGTEQKPWSQVFGKAFVDIDGSVRSTAGNTTTRADVTLLPTSNITYVMQEEVTELGNKVDENMVTFINMKDSTANETIIKTAAAQAASSVTANINVNQGAKIGVYLSEDGKNRATVDGSGQLKYSIDFTGKDRLNGTYTIESGNVRYTPPIVSQKNFDIASGSTIQWSGDMLNPQLNLTATEKDRSSVTGEDGKGRLVDFIVTAKLGGTLNNMKLDFDIEAENDMTVQNELQSMSEMQRSQTAINLLLYGTYSGNTAGALGNLSSISASGALLQFLQSQLNTWAGKAVPGLDISFGINQYEGTRTGGTETSYSYRLAKNLFNDRFKIAVGGEYSTEASAEQNFSQNLISDLSLEYMLNDAGSRYLRAFRHTGYESILEGQVTKTGVGFVMKHKLNSIDDLFRKSMNKTVTQPRDTVKSDTVNTSQ
ncbi:MAG: translocation/assembly module TamB domain-containing protein, partial [Muribaculaceae bacterium]|nr:translocation/assembly module TamB domain-containing protein [Muribaculaceae bacterium]